ncbi:hypothetical protein JDV02_002383 [Purpureocillium takamizusanense]|uniref:Uncharacterized protein n=1 Tax=Purpureocillium takamizusanense TaxID=2060973 RepID=A0A9Q8QAV5_9HYPO|nr:uncharacterized protein JDV02_002383 [Purpureocillium takamizusanense]UNI15897.1 hypothetical protein JDV02_002383 [Purpureocillium takamizusanense]
MGTASYRVLATALFAACGSVARVVNADKEAICPAPATLYIQHAEAVSVTPVLISAWFPEKTNIVIDEQVTVPVTNVPSAFSTVVTKTKIARSVVMRRYSQPTYLRLSVSYFRNSELFWSRPAREDEYDGFVSTQSHNFQAHMHQEPPRKHQILDNQTPFLLKEFTYIEYNRNQASTSTYSLQQHEEFSGEHEVIIHEAKPHAHSLWTYQDLDMVNDPDKHPACAYSFKQHQEPPW